MDSTMIQENLQEYINDESKIVTYRWLSLTLNINVNQAKQELYNFTVCQRNEGGNDDINVTYFVAGLGRSKDGEPLHKCVVVPESHLDVVKSSLQPVTSCHVYSVQKAKLKDTATLYQTDYDIIKENLTVSPSLSSIVCPWAVMRDVKTLQSSKDIKSSSSEPTNSISKKSNVKEESPNNTTSTSNEAVSNKAKKTEKKGSIASMFASAGKKGENGQQSNAAEKSQTNKQKNKPADKKGGMMAFLSAQQKEKSTEKSSAVTSKPGGTKDTTTTKIMEKKESPSENLKEKSSKKTKQKKNSEIDVPSKQRKRIRTDLFDSSEEDEDNSEAEIEEEEENGHNKAILDEEEEDDPKEDIKSEDESETKPDSEPVKQEIPQTKTTADGCRKRKRKRKLVPKQYVDEEGFMVTEKVWESDSTDASDHEVLKTSEEKDKNDSNKTAVGKSSKSEPKSKPPPKKSAASPVKGKQTSLMSFFKKK